VGKTFYFKENEKLKTESGAKNNSQLPKGWEVKKLGEVLIYSVKSLKFKKYTIQLSKIIFLLGLTTWA
jgi:hypothetical protein